MSLAIKGTVYGTLLNFRAEYEAWAPHMHEAPYKAPPKAPVLYLKPANTWSGDGASIVVPRGTEQIEIGATVGLVMKAPGQVGSLVLMNDWSIPHTSYYRPPVKFKCLDGFLGIGSPVNAQGLDPRALAIEVRVNDRLRQTVRFDDLVRTPAQLLADVSEFMTLGTGDVLLLGLAAERPLARAGDIIDISSEPLGRLRQQLVAEAA
jgi:5-oxopent-3-ene-1,2,5-tricarboxylate decarboxylase/2-hydroxyhepta-2,4-diene-1,7-dioate isomerase